MRDETRIPLIFLPGPVQAAHTVTVRAKSNDYQGADFEVIQSFDSDGRGMVQVEEMMNLFYSRWHQVLGCEIGIDFGKGSIKRVLNERFGVLSLEEIGQ